MRPTTTPGGDTFIGRENELGVLQAAWAQAQAGQGRMVLCAGEPGIGKTRTAEEIARFAAAQGGRVLWGRCYESAGAPAFWPWVQILRASMRELGPETLREVVGTGIAELAQLVPELRDARSGDDGSLAGDSAEVRFRLFDALARVLDALAQHAPLLVVLDDVHGADASSLQLLHFLGQQVRHFGVLLVATYRDTGGAVDGPLQEMLLEVQREAGTQRLDLRGLSAAEVGRFIEARTGQAARADVVAELHRRTEGNPLFVGEYVRLLLSKGDEGARLDVAQVRGLIPHGVKVMIARRLAPLSAACRRVLSIAAVMGREFRADTVRQVIIGVLMMLGQAASGGEAVAAELAEAEASGVLSETLDRMGYRFSHALIRETLYEGLDPSERVRLHRQVGEALEQGIDAEDRVAELAYHFSATGSSEDAGKAVTYARRGGDRARKLLAYEEAIRLYELALSLLDQHPGAHAEPRREQCALLVALGETQRDAGGVARSKQTLQAGARLAAEQCDRDLLARAALGYGNKMGWGEGGVADPILIALLERALEAWGNDDGGIPAELRARLAMALIFTSEKERSRSVSREAVDMARRTGDSGVIAYALWAWCYANWAPDNLAARLATADEIIRCAEAARDQHLVFQGRIVRLDGLFESADRRVMDAELRECHRLVAELPEPFHRWYLSLASVALATMEGRFAEASQLAQDGLAIGESAGAGASVLFTLQMFVLHRTRWQADAVRLMTDAIEALVAQQPLAFVAELVILNRLLDRRAETQAHFDRFAHDDFVGLELDQNWLPNASHLAEACAYLDDTRGAAVLYALMLPSRLRAATIVGPTAYFGPVEHYLGMLATTLAHWDDAQVHFQAALETNSRMRALPWLARTQCEYAAMLLARQAPGDAQRAVSLIEPALATARQLEMPGLIDRLSNIAARAAVRPVEPPEPDESAATHAGARAHRLPVFLRQGDYWSIGYRGVTARLQHRKGLEYLAYLIRNPHRECQVFELLDEAATAATNAAAGRRPAPPASLGPLVDVRARRAYRERVREARVELEEAERHHDIGRADRLRAELEKLSSELRGAVGIGGHERRVAPELERARSAVGKRIRTEIGRIAAVHPVLSRHLAATISTGYFCTYRPDRDDV